jgi:hypothetical protein
VYMDRVERWLSRRGSREEEREAELFEEEPEPVGAVRDGNGQG